MEEQRWGKWEVAVRVGGGGVAGRRPVCAGQQPPERQGHAFRVRHDRGAVS